MFQLSPRRAPALRAELAASGYSFRTVPYALFSAKGDGVVATFYESGKLVVQGEGARMFAARWVENAADGGGAGASKSTGGAERDASNTTTSEGSRDVETPLVGSDECGKGDYFGPLVVCAVRLEPAERRALAGGMVRDSKTLSDEACRRLGAALRSKYRFAIARLDPPEYNAAWARIRNVNEVLADLHARAIRELAQPKDHVLVDKFADEGLLRRRLKDLDIALEQRVRAEAEIAVAAASIIAREEFLNALAELSEAAAVDLHKGAGDPVDAAGRRFIAIHGRAGLAKVAKLHFKNTQKLGGAPE